MRKKSVSFGAMFVVVACSSPSEVVESPSNESIVDDASGNVDASVVRARDEGVVTPFSDAEVDAGTNVSEAVEDDSGGLPGDSDASDSGIAIVDSGELDSGVAVVDSGPAPLSCASYLAGRPIPPDRTSVRCAKLSGTAREQVNFTWTSSSMVGTPNPCGGAEERGSSNSRVCCTDGPFDSGKLAVPSPVFALVETFSNDGGVLSKLTLVQGESIEYAQKYEFSSAGDLSETARDLAPVLSRLEILHKMTYGFFWPMKPPLRDSSSSWAYRKGAIDGGFIDVHGESLTVRAAVSAGLLDVRISLLTTARGRNFSCPNLSHATFSYDGVGALQTIP